jgi:hypothetical protein
MQALPIAQRSNSCALQAAIAQLQQLHQQASRQFLPQQGASATVQPHANVLCPSDFWSLAGYQAWLYHSWQCLQEQLLQLQQLPAYSAQLQLQLQGATLGVQGQRSSSNCFR